MGIGKKMIASINEAVEKNDKTLFMDIYNNYGEDTKITSSYEINRLLDSKNKPEWKIITSPEELKKYRIRRGDKAYTNKPNNITISFEEVKEVVDQKDSGVRESFVYTLLNTGRRQSEILNSKMKIENGKLFMQLMKSRDKSFKEIKPLNNDPVKTYHEIDALRFVMANKYSPTSLSRVLNDKLNIRKNHPEFTVHNLRGIYSYIWSIREQRPLAYVIDKYLHHEGNSSKYYNHLKYSFTRDPFQKSVKSMTVKELKALAKKLKVVGFSKMRKAELIESVKHIEN